MKKLEAARRTMLPGLLRQMLAGLFLVSASATATLAADKTILVYGDSLMAGLGLDAQNAFVGQLQAALDDKGLGIKLLNASVSGDTTASGLARLEWTLAEKPDAVIVGLGANDMLQGLPVANAQKNLSSILDRFAGDHVPVLLAGMLADPGLGADYVDAFDAMYPALSQQYGTLLYPFFLDGVALDPKLNQADLKHPNQKGVAIIVDKILPWVEKLAAEAS